MPSEGILKILQGLPTAVVGAIAVYIAWQQWKTNRTKLILDRYDRRVQVYKEVDKFIRIGIRDSNYDDDELFTFRLKVSEVYFLFGDEVSKYIDELHRRAVNLSHWHKEYRDDSQPKPEGYNHKKVVDEMHKERVWIDAQIEPARNIFKKYLDVSK
jgi:hypothetical protein